MREYIVHITPVDEYKYEFEVIRHKEVISMFTTEMVPGMDKVKDHILIDLDGDPL